MNTSKNPVKGKSKSIAGSVFEQLKNLGSDTIKSTASEAAKIARDVPSNILRGPQGYEGLNENPDLPYSPERLPRLPEQPQKAKNPEILLFSNIQREEEVRVNREVQIVLSEIRKEIVVLEKRQKMVIAEASRISMQQVPEKVGIYHVRFFEWILTLLRDLHKKVGESATWLAHMNSKKSKKGYWSMFKKHGTSFGLSSERTIATQAG